MIRFVGMCAARGLVLALLVWLAFWVQSEPPMPGSPRLLVVSLLAVVAAPAWVLVRPLGGVTSGGGVLAAMVLNAMLYAFVGLLLALGQAPGGAWRRWLLYATIGAVAVYWALVAFWVAGSRAG
jgi:hypothetical protein